ncbi:MAG: glycosyltransferase family 4 protein [Patescibacteria group bacterium]
MKIAFIGQKGIPTKFGGIERHAENLAVNLAQLGHEIFVYTRPWYTDKQLKEYKGVRLISVPSIKTKHLDAISHAFFCSLHALFKSYDIVHYHGVGPSLAAWIPKLFKWKTKIIVTFHCRDSEHDKWGSIARFFLRLGEWLAIAIPDETITVSQSLQKYCQRQYHKKTIYIPNGADIPDMVGDNIIFEKFGLRRNSYLLIAVRLVRHKRLDLLINAFKNIKTEKRLVIAGGSAFTDDYVASIKKLAADDKRILFTGYQSGESLSQLFANALVFVHPSDLEGLPVSVIESMSFAVPPLVSSIPEHLELIPDDLHSYLVFKQGSVGDLEIKLSRLIQNTNWLPTFGQRLRELVKENYNWQNIAFSTEKLYKDTLTRSQIKKINPARIIN